MAVPVTIPRLSRNIAHALMRGLVALLMLSHALLAFSSVISLSHDPLRAGNQAHEFAQADTNHDDHAHSHEAFDDEGGMHQHGHNPADHSHDKPNVPPTHGVSSPPLFNWWLADEHRLAYLAPCACPERPPKCFSIV